MYIICNFSCFKKDLLISQYKGNEKCEQMSRIKVSKHISVFLWPLDSLAWYGTINQVEAQNAIDESAVVFQMHLCGRPTKMSKKEVHLHRVYSLWRQNLWTKWQAFYFSVMIYRHAQVKIKMQTWPSSEICDACVFWQELYVGWGIVLQKVKANKITARTGLRGVAEKRRFCGIASAGL